MLLNITKSKGSPLICPSILVSEWQVAIAWIKGDLLSMEVIWSHVTTLPKLLSQGITQSKSSPSCVSVPVCDNQIQFRVDVVV